MIRAKKKETKKMETKTSCRSYDMIILGATGFTGKYVVKEALKFLNSPNTPLKTLAIAGRNREKLSLSCPDKNIPILIADTNDHSSLLYLAQHTKLLLNCVGPFRLYGEPVVKACIEAGTDYLDICGEPEYMERIEARYHNAAAESGTLVLSACGFDSVPAEFGLMFNSLLWEGNSAPNRVEAYLSLESDKKMAGNFGTYESAVLSVANADKLMELRRSRPRLARPEIPGPPAPKGPVIEHQKKVGSWAVKLPSADAIVVRRAQATIKENPRGLPGVKESDEHISKREAFWAKVKPAHFGVKLTNKSLIGVLAFTMFGVSLGILGKFSLGRWLLLKFPSFFSFGIFRKEGPTEEEVASASFKMWFIGHGFSDSNVAKQGNVKPDMEIITRVTGPEIGYVTTPIIIVQCALIVLSQRENLPKGGVYTPGVVFGPTDLQKRLQENGMSFDFISKNAISA